MTIKETVVIELLSKGFKQFSTQINKGFKQVSENATEFGNVMGLNQKSFAKNAEGLRKNATAGGRLATNIRLLTGGLKGFRMEMLGVMFFGMAMQRMFFGFLQPVMETFGVFDMFRIMLLTLFLPLMEKLFEPMMNIMMWFIDLPDSAKMAIGVFTLIGVIVGTLLMLIGTLALGVSSLILVFGKTLVIGTIFKVIGSIGTLFSVTMAAILAVVTIVLIGIWLAWRDNFMNIKDWITLMMDGIKNIISGILEIIKGQFNFFFSLLTGDTKGAINAMKQIWEGLKSFFNGLGEFFLGIVATVLMGIARFFLKLFEMAAQVGVTFRELVVDALIKSFNIIDNLFGGALTKALKFGLDFISKIAEGIKAGAGAVWEAIKGAFGALGGLLGGSGSSKDRITGFSSPSGRGSVKSQNDFLMRPGQGPVSFSPNDTIIGTKGGLPGGSTNINQTLNINVSDSREIERMIDDNNKKLVDDIRRLTPTGG